MSQYGNYNQVGYGQQDNQYGGSGGRGYTQQSGVDVEMQPVNGGGATGNNPNAILDDCREIDRAIDELDGRLSRLEQTHRGFLTSTNPGRAATEIRDEGTSIMAAYQALVQRVRKIKSLPASGHPRNAPQVGKVDRRLRASIQQYQRLESEFRHQAQEAQARQYRIVRPDATEEEVREACEDPNQQVFQQALLQQGRSGQAQSALSNVRARHALIQNIEQTMVELAQLFQDLDAIVTQQEPLVASIEQKAEQVHEDVVKANTELVGAIDSARSRNRKKWWCLLVVLLIIVVIVVIAVVVTLVNKKS